MERVDGELIGYVERRGSKGGRLWAPVVRFTHPRHGPRVLEAAAASNGFSRKPGERVAVLVDPEDPARACLAGVGGSLFALLPAAVAKALGGAVVPEAEYDRRRLVPESELAEACRRARLAASVAGVVLLLLAAGLFAASKLWSDRRADFLARARSAPGKVVRMVRGSKNARAPIVAFDPGWGGEKVEFRHPVASSHPSWTEGQDVRVLYDPADPSSAMIDQGRWNTATPWIPGAVGGLLGLLGLLALRSTALSD